MTIAASPLAALAQTPAPGVPASIVIASEGARPPYNYFEGEKLGGFEIDLGLDLCRRMRATCRFVPQTWDDMIPGLLAHRYDAIMAAMEITAQRSAAIAFSVPYVQLPSAFVVRRDSSLRGDSPEDLAGHRLGAEKGGTHQLFLEKVYPQSIVKRYNSFDEALLDLEAGRIDAAIGDKDAAVRFLENRRDAACCRLLADVPRDPRYFGEGIGVGLRKEDVALRDAFNAAIKAAMADGTFAQISARYFDFSIIEPAAPGTSNMPRKAAGATPR